MKQPGEELQETLMELDDRAVVDYLQRNPEFFIRNAQAVEAMRVSAHSAGHGLFSGMAYGAGA